MLSFSASFPFFPLRTDRSFDSGSKFTLQTYWEAGEHSSGKAFLRFKERGHLSDSLSGTLRLIIALPLHSCGCEARAGEADWLDKLLGREGSSKGEDKAQS